MQVEQLRKIIQELELTYTLNLPMSAPRSPTIRRHTNDSSLDLHEKKEGYFKSIKKLYTKYLDQNAILEVNVSYKTRRALIETFGNLNESESDRDAFIATLPVIEKAVVEVSMLMLDSMGRFRGTEVYAKLMAMNEG